MTQEDIVILSQLLDQKFEPVYTRLDLLESDVRELKSGMSEIKQRVASVDLPLLFQGKPKLRGGGAVSAQTKRNTANRIAHGS